MLTTFILETSPILNDKCQLQAYPFVVTDPIDLEVLSYHGMDLVEFVDQEPRDDRKILTIKANLLTDMKQVKKSASTYCLDQFDSMYCDRDKGLFVCFQVAIDGTAKQHDIHPNRKWATKSAREKAFATRRRIGNDKSKLPHVPANAEEAEETKSL